MTPTTKSTTANRTNPKFTRWMLFMQCQFASLSRGLHPLNSGDAPEPGFGEGP